MNIIMFPPVLYKYTLDLRFLENGKFRFSQPDALNDPHEAQPRIVFQEYAPEDYAAARAETKFDMPQEELEASHLHPFPARRFDEKGFPGLWPATEPRLRAEPFKTIEEFDRAVVDKAVSLCRKFANGNFGIFCMTESTDDSLWAYYAGDHKGVSVSFDARHPFFSASNVLFKIDYSETAIPVSSNQGIVRVAGQRVRQESILEERIDDIPLDLLLRKRTSWSHEKEWRMIKNLQEGQHSGRDDSNGVPVFLFDVPPACIMSITFGYKAADAEISRARHIVENSSVWNHVVLRKRRRLSNGSMEETDCVGQ